MYVNRSINQNLITTGRQNTPISVSHNSLTQNIIKTRNYQTSSDSGLRKYVKAIKNLITIGATNYAYFGLEQKSEAIAARRENGVKIEENRTPNDSCLIMDGRKWTGRKWTGRKWTGRKWTGGRGRGGSEARPNDNLTAPQVGRMSQISDFCNNYS